MCIKKVHMRKWHTVSLQIIKVVIFLNKVDWVGYKIIFPPPFILISLTLFPLVSRAYGKTDRLIQKANHCSRN